MEDGHFEDSVNGGRDLVRCSFYALAYQTKFENASLVFSSSKESYLFHRLYYYYHYLHCSNELIPNLERRYPNSPKPIWIDCRLHFGWAPVFWLRGRPKTSGNGQSLRSWCTLGTWRWLSLGSFVFQREVLYVLWHCSCFIGFCALQANHWQQFGNIPRDSAICSFIHYRTF